MDGVSSRRALEESKPSSHVKGVWGQHRWCENSIPITLRPIRLIQLILDIMLLSVTVSLMTVKSKNSLNTAASIILIILFATFAIIMSIDAVGQIRGWLTPDFPMLIVALLGFILFASAAQAVYLMLVYQKIENSSIPVLIALCLVGALLFLLDAVIMILYWRYTYTKKKCLPCYPDTGLKIIYQKPIQEKVSEILELSTRDISTSFSQERWQSFHSGFLGHRSNNRIGIGPRRQYVDTATSPDSKISPKLVETQTQKIEPAKHIDHEISAIAVVEEKCSQTLSECPMCSASLDYSPEEICPTFLNLVQSFGMFPCAGNLRVQPEALVLVDRGTLPGSNSSLKVSDSTIVITKKPPRVYGTRPCPTHGAGLIAQKAGLPCPVKKITLTHSIRKNKRTQTPGIRPIVITEKYQNTEINTAEETTNTESFLHLPREGLSEHQSSETVDIGTEQSSDFVKIKESKTGIKAQNSPEFENSFSGQESFEKAKVQTLKSSGIKSIEGSTTGIKNASVSKEESLSLKVLTSFERRDSHTDSEDNASMKDIVKLSTTSYTEMLPMKNGSYEGLTSQNIFQRNNNLESSISTRTSLLREISSYFAEVSSPHESPIYPIEISKHSNRTKEFSSPSSSCKCSQYYYKDIFGRNICSLCAHKYLIKIPQRCTVKTVVDKKCCSCYRDIIYQAPTIAGYTKCQRCCKSRYQMYISSKK